MKEVCTMLDQQLHMFLFLIGSPNNLFVLYLQLGHHEELMKKKGLYAELVRHQTIEGSSSL